jgi:hypothetical protein
VKEFTDLVQSNSLKVPSLKPSSAAVVQETPRFKDEDRALQLIERIKSSCKVPLKEMFDSIELNENDELTVNILSRNMKRVGILPDE